jgi:hypothetical protein
MVQHRTMLVVADNSGAKQLQVIHIYGGSKRSFGYLGETLGCVVKKALPHGQFKKGVYGCSFRYDSISYFSKKRILHQTNILFYLWFMCLCLCDGSIYSSRCVYKNWLVNASINC